PNMQRMMHIIHEKYGENAPEWFRTEFRSYSLPLMKYTNMLSFNTRVIALFVSLLINEPWLYFVFELTVLNGMLIYMKMTHERFCAKLSCKLEGETK
ncbi:MAG: CDP-alcohol phosphatidyltransferase family protein, partial [Tannerellaceae bacterium]